MSEDWSGRFSLHTRDGDALHELASEIVPGSEQEWWAEQATGDSAYLESALYWHDEKEKMVDTVEILPHFHLYDEDEFSARILDETGWDPEGHAALYELTGKNRFRESGRKYMDKHMKVFQREDGHSYSIGQSRKWGYLKKAQPFGAFCFIIYTKPKERSGTLKQPEKPCYGAWITSIPDRILKP